MSSSVWNGNGESGQEEVFFYAINTLDWRCSCFLFPFALFLYQGPSGYGDHVWDRGGLGMQLVAIWE